MITPRLNAIAVCAGLIAAIGWSTTALAGIEEHSPNPDPLFLEILLEDLEAAEELLEQESETEEASDEPMGWDPLSAVNSAEQLYLEELELKWTLARFGIDYVASGERDLPESLELDPADEAEVPEESVEFQEEGNPEETPVTMAASTDDEEDDESEELGEVESRLEQDDDIQPMAGCTAASGNSAGLWFAVLMLLALGVRRRLFA